MKIGLSLPQSTAFDLSTDVTTFAAEVERLGFDSLWAYERVLRPVDMSGSHGLYGMPDVPWPERYGQTADPLIVLALAAAVTRRVEIGTGVLVPGLHLPVRLAKTLASLDAASGGRLIAGLGSGWSADEFAATAPRPLSERGRALDEFLDVAAAVWGSDPVSFGNERWTVAPSEINPKPARTIPVFLAGSNRTALSRIARRADGWLPTAVPPDRVGVILGQIREMAAEAGRDPHSIGCIFQITVRDGLAEVPAEGRQPYTGNARQLAEDVAALEAAGVTHAYLTNAAAARGLDEALDQAAELRQALR